MPKRSRPIAISTKRPSSRRCKSRISTIVPTEQGISCKGRLSGDTRSEEHTSELQSRLHLVCRLLLEKKKTAPHSASCYCTIPRRRTIVSPRNNRAQAPLTYEVHSRRQI